MARGCKTTTKKRKLGTVDSSSLDARRANRKPTNCPLAPCTSTAQFRRNDSQTKPWLSTTYRQVPHGVFGPCLRAVVCIGSVCVDAICIESNDKGTL